MGGRGGISPATKRFLAKRTGVFLSKNTVLGPFKLFFLKMRNGTKVY